MSDDVIFRSNHPDVMKTWTDLQDAIEAYRERENALIVELKPKGRKKRHPLHQRHFGCMPLFECFEALEGDVENPPDGWKVKRRTAGGVTQDCLEPDKRRKAGKDIDSQMRELRRSAPSDPRFSGAIPGVPAAFLHMPGIEQHDEYLYLIYGAKDESHKKVSRKFWEPIKLSTFYLAKESTPSP